MTTEQGRDTEERTLLVLVLGRCVLQGGKPGLELVEVTEDDLEAAKAGKRPAERESMLFGGKVDREMRTGAGAVYEVTSPREGSLYLGTAKWRTMWPDQDFLAELRVKDRAARTELERRKAEAKGRRLNGLEGLEPIRTAYRAARGVHKSIILAQVVAYITGGG